MDYLSIAEVEQRVLQLSKRIDVPEDVSPTFGYSEDFARPHIEVNGSGYHFVVIERGTEWERRTTTKLTDLLYWIFEYITSFMAWNFEKINRVSNQDSRILVFSKQMELMNRIDQEYARRLNDEINQILKMAPFQNT